jgi:hypothetical protein
MRCLSKLECEQFAQSAGLTMTELMQLANDDEVNGAIRVVTENQRHRAYFLATRCVALLGDFAESLLWVTDFGIWPSSENQWLYYRLRRALGDKATLAERPGHLLNSIEKDDFVAFVHLALEFGWGAFIFSRPLSRYVHLSHDGWLRIFSPPSDTSVAENIKDWSVSYELESGDGRSGAGVH